MQSVDGLGMLLEKDRRRPEVTNAHLDSVALSEGVSSTLNWFALVDILLSFKTVFYFIGWTSGTSFVG